MASMTAIGALNDRDLEDAAQASQRVVRTLEGALVELGEMRRALDELERVQHTRERQATIVVVPARRWGFRRVV